jgi:hypothetical protein
LKVDSTADCADIADKLKSYPRHPQFNFLGDLGGLAVQSHLFPEELAGPWISRQSPILCLHFPRG